MEPKTIIGIVLVVFIIAGLVFLRFRKKNRAASEIWCRPSY